MPQAASHPTKKHSRSGSGLDRGGERTIRLAIQQPSLPGYRVPVFRELARRRGVRLHVHYSAQGPVPSVEPDGFEATATPMRMFRRGSFYWHAPQWRCATRRACDVLILSWDLRYAGLVPALVRARASGVRTILWGHGFSKNEKAWRRRLRNRVGRMADAVLVYNYAAARRLIGEGFAPGRVHIALNSLDQAPIREAQRDWLARPDDLAAFEARHGLGPGPVVLFVSRFEPENRLDLLLHAAARLLPSFPHLRVAIVGKGPDGERMEALSRRLGLSEHILFPGAIYDESDLAPWFLSADAFCYPANIGLSLLHAFGYGLPVVTSDRLGSQNPEIEALEDGVNGLVYPHGDAEALARVLARLLGDGDLRRRMGEAARATVRDRFSIAAMVDGMEGAIRQAVTE